MVIIAALESAQKPEFISYPSTTLDSEGIPVRLNKSLRFHIRNFKDVSGKFDCPFSHVEYFRILIYSGDDELVQNYTLRPEHIEET